MEMNPHHPAESTGVKSRVGYFMLKPIPARSMKKTSSRSGFTLVELLVVIAIIAILASVITVAASGAINAAKRAKAANMGSQIQTAILAYNTEYGVYPVPDRHGSRCCV